MKDFKQDYVEILGTVEDIVFSSGDTGFTVLNLSMNDELICVVGSMLGVSVGEELKLTGRFTTHPTYGQQFKAEMYERHLPATANAIYRYLSSGVIKGIRASVARKIVDQFGDDTLKILEETPERLTEVSGISQKKADRYIESFREIFSVRTLMLFLSKYGINPAQSVAVWKKWDKSAKDMITCNPYVLCTLEVGISFATADSIAADYQIAAGDPMRILAGLQFVLQFNTNNGHTCLPQPRLIESVASLLNVGSDEILPVLEDALEQALLYRVKKPDLGKEFIFLPNFYIAETYIVSRLKAMTQKTEEPNDALEQLIDGIEREKNIHYEALQRKAIEQAMTNTAFILTGGPGTGKTTTVNGILDLLEYSEKKVVVAAPTGRAAKRIAEVTGRDAKTIHRLLEVEFGHNDVLTFTHNEGNPLECDAVIIDEMSMIDTLLFESLLRGMKTSCKLIMIGDFHQLPSVGAGNILHDMLASDQIPTVQLKQIFRQAAESLIITNAHSIVHGQMPDLTQKDNDFFFLSAPNTAAASVKIIDLCATRLPKTYNYSVFENIQVLCPQRKGESGVIELNKRLQERLNPAAPLKAEFKNMFYTFREGDKIMQIKNNYHLSWRKDGEEGEGVFNGDIGLIKMVDTGSKTMLIDFDGRAAYYSFEMANELELAYAITVHKSQGSEFDAVIVPVLGGYDKLYYRNLLYTAVTRAKKLLILVGSKQRVQFMVENNIRMLRYTGLRQFLEE